MDKNITISGWDSFSPYTVGIIRGWRIYEKNLTHAKQLITVNNAEQLFSLLLNARSDLIMYEDYPGSWWNKQHNAKAHKVGLLAKKDMFMYMHKQHIDLVPQITQTLKQMKQDGSFQKIKDLSLPNVK